MPADKTTSIIAALLLGCVGVFAIMAQPILTAALVGQMGMNPGNAGAISAAEALGTAIGPVAALFWMQRVKWRTAAAFALAVVIAGNVLSSLQTSFASLVALRFAVGVLGQGTAFALAVAIVSGTQQKDRNFAFLIAAQVALGVLMFLLLPLPRDSAVAGVLLPLAGFALLALLTIGWIPQSGTAGAHHAAAAGGGSATPAIFALVVMLIWCSGLGAVWAFVKLIGQAGGLEDLAVGQALGLSTALGTLGALAASALADRFGRILPVAVGLLMQIAMVSLLRGEMGWAQFAATAAVFQIFWNMTGPYLMGTVALSDTTGKVSLLIPTAQISGFFLGPVIVGLFLTEGSYVAANYVGAACMLVALLLFIPAASRLRRAPVAVGP